ncbi:MAG: hypothetical protein WCC53_09420 [Thermoanaerobaculia bacterium]
MDTRRIRSTRLVRTSEIFEFLVRYPWGSSAISGYRRAARHFGFHTREDPTFEGSDAYRVFVDKSAAALRRVVKALEIAYSSGQQNVIDDAEAELAGGDVIWFAQDWKHWEAEQDEGALERLGLKRRIVEAGKSYLVTLKVVKGRRSRRRGLG